MTTLPKFKTTATSRNDTTILKTWGPWYNGYPEYPTQYVQNLFEYETLVKNGYIEKPINHDIQHPYTLIRSKKTTPYGEMGRDSGSSRFQEIGVCHRLQDYLTAPQSYITPDDCGNRALNKLLASLKDSKINVALALGERKQTADLVGKTVMRFVNVVRLLRKGAWNRAATQLGLKPFSKGQRRRFNKMRRLDLSAGTMTAVSSSWLELQYGWKPLIQDVYGAVELLRTREETVRPLFKVEGRASSRDYKKVWSSIPSFGGTRTAIGKGRSSSRYVVVCSTDSSAQTLSANLGLTNPALLAWELVPFSFVCDWFLPIGQYLENLDASFGYQFHSGTYSKVVELNSSEEFVLPGAPFNKVYQYWGRSKGSWYYLSYTREVLTAFPSPRLPRFKNPVSLTHALNAIALLYAVFGRQAPLTSGKSWKKTFLGRDL